MINVTRIRRNDAIARLLGGVRKGETGWEFLGPEIDSICWVSSSSSFQTSPHMAIWALQRAKKLGIIFRWTITALADLHLAEVWMGSWISTQGKHQDVAEAICRALIELDGKIKECKRRGIPLHLAVNLDEVVEDLDDDSNEITSEEASSPLTAEIEVESIPPFAKFMATVIFGANGIPTSINGWDVGLQRAYESSSWFTEPTRSTMWIIETAELERGWREATGKDRS